MGPIMECLEVAKTFKKSGRLIKAVDNVSLSIAPGESLGLVGGSGCGKSTLARVMARLTRMDSGRVVLDGRDISRLNGGELRECYRTLQMVFQDPFASFDPRQTIGRGLLEVLSNFNVGSSGQRKDLVRQALESVGLNVEFGGRLPGDLSGGQCQRAAIARALLVRPRLLICDEATSALDAIVQAQILNLLRKLRDEMGLSVLFISHDLALVRAFCSRIAVMHDGRIVESGPAEKVIAQPEHPHTRLLLSSLITLGESV
ncbi:ABC transporter ATP-binding protein [Deltaproteobacteria bacterium Smac51]|nr:ABC transporter ATP-binding protein [Deltaproteobacteria bacterium Smac51]